ncbi:MAG: hypothetical protein WC979_09145, partial [Candidatus Pacearchaeota archaeon]
LFNWNKTYADSLYYGLSNPFGFYNETTLPNLNSTGLIRDWNSTGLIKNWSSESSSFNESNYYNSSQVDSQFSALVMVPVGSVISYVKNLTNTPALPDGWVECNGQTLSDAESVYNGIVIPNLNGNNYFLMGNSSGSGSTGGESTHTLTIGEMPAHQHTQSANLGGTGYPAFTGSGQLVTIVSTSGGGGSSPLKTVSAGGSEAHENKPPYYSVVWIMRVK